MRFLTALLLIAMLPQQAEACAWLTPEGQRVEQKRQERWLRKESNKVVVGTWSLVSSTEIEGGGYFIEGMITSTGKQGKPKLLKTYHSDTEINCGFPFLPDNGARGKFYLDGDDDGSYQLVHFKPAAGGR